MNTWARKSFKVGVLSAGALLFAGTAANAADLNSAGNIGIGNGNQASTVTQAPVDICGNAVGVLGVASAQCVGGSWASLGSGTEGADALNSFGNIGIGNGNQVSSTIQAPIDVCGNAVGVLGAAQAQCVGGSAAVIGGGGGGDYGQYASANHVQANHVKATHVKATHIKAAHAKKSHSTEAAHVTEAASTLNSFGNIGLANGNQVSSVIQVPIDVCGNAISLLGAAQASCEGGAAAVAGGGNDESAQALNSGFNIGIANGNQVSSVIQAPIDVCGNAIGVLGAASASCQGGALATTGGGNGGGGNGGGYSGYNYSKPGSSEAASAYAPNAGSAGGSCVSQNSFGNIGIGNGNQVSTVTQAPVEISGNAIGLLGVAQAQSVGGAFASC